MARVPSERLRQGASRPAVSEDISLPNEVRTGPSRVGSISVHRMVLVLLRERGVLVLPRRRTLRRDSARGVACVRGSGQRDGVGAGALGPRGHVWLTHCPTAVRDRRPSRVAGGRPRLVVHFDTARSPICSHMEGAAAQQTHAKRWTCSESRPRLIAFPDVSLRQAITNDIPTR